MYLQGEEFSEDRNNDVFDASKQIISEEDSSNDQESSEKIASFKYGNELAEEEDKEQQEDCGVDRLQILWFIKVLQHTTAKS